MLLAGALAFGLATGAIFGRTIDQKTGQPLVDCQVRLQLVNGVAYSDSSGRFTIGDLKPGMHWAEVSGSYHERRLVRLTVGDTTVVELRRTSYPCFEQSRRAVQDPTVPRPVAGTIRVRATDEHRQPVAGVSVHVDPGGFCLTDASGWCVFPAASGGRHPIRIGSLLHEIQTDTVLVKDREVATLHFAMRVREPYRNRKGVTLNSRGDLTIDDGSSATLYLRTGGEWIMDRIPDRNFSR